MLRAELKDGEIFCENGFNASPWTVTRYGGEQWERVGAALLCGVADVFPDVGIVTTGSSSIDLEAIPLAAIVDGAASEPRDDGWVPISPGHAWKSVFASIENRWRLFVPNCRESVEQVMSWTMWSESPDLAFRSTAFSGYKRFRQELGSVDWAAQGSDLQGFIRERCLEKALFQMGAGPGAWSLIPGSLELSHLFRLAEPVMTRINTELTD